jgi:hypothetical protein
MDADAKNYVHTLTPINALYTYEYIEEDESKNWSGGFGDWRNHHMHFAIDFAIDENIAS